MLLRPASHCPLKVVTVLERTPPADFECCISHLLFLNAHLLQVLNVAFLIVAFLCSFIGGAGYYMYGSAAADIVIFNMPGVLAMIWCVPSCAMLCTHQPCAGYCMYMYCQCVSLPCPASKPCLCTIQPLQKLAALYAPELILCMRHACNIVAL